MISSCFDHSVHGNCSTSTNSRGGISAPEFLSAILAWRCQYSRGGGGGDTAWQGIFQFGCYTVKFHSSTI